MAPLPVNEELNGTLKECVTKVAKRYVDCRNKTFERIPTDLLNSTVKNIYLGGNQYVCDCSMVWFLEARKHQDFGIKIIDDKAVTCAKPEKLRGRKVGDVTRTEICPATAKVCNESICSHVNATCRLINNTHECVCIAGFTGNGTHCSDIDECLTGACNQKEVCRNNIGSYSCDCKTGFTRLNGAKECVYEVKSCEAVLKPCQSKSQVCVNRDNGFQCKCSKGFYKEEDGHDECLDLNECQQSHCSSHAQCINLIGSYKCFCREGFTGNGKHCEDVDECSLKSYNCRNDSVCMNHVGGYKCRCKPGFEQSKKGNLCIETEKSSLLDLVTSYGPIGGLVLLIPPAFLAMICCLCRIRSRKKKATTGKSSPNEPLESEDNPAEQEPLLSKDQEPLQSQDQDAYLMENQGQVQQQIYMYNNYFDDLPAEGILPNQSTLSAWSEDDEIDYQEDYNNFDDD